MRWAARGCLGGCVPLPLPSPPLGSLCARWESKTFLVSSDSPFVLIWIDVVVNYLLFACLHSECAAPCLFSVRCRGGPTPSPIFCLLQEQWWGLCGILEAELINPTRCWWLCCNTAWNRSQEPAAWRGPCNLWLKCLRYFCWQGKYSIFPVNVLAHSSGLLILDVFLACWELNSVILMGPFQSEVFCDLSPFPLLPSILSLTAAKALLPLLPHLF